MPVSRGSTRPVGTSPLAAAQQRTEQLSSAPEIRQADLGSGAWGQPAIIRILARYRTESHGPKLSLKPEWMGDLLPLRDQPVISA